MGIIIALSDVRAHRLRSALYVFAREHRAAIVETCDSLIVAERILCQDSLVEIYNSAGDYFVVRYSDIVGVAAVAVAQIRAIDNSGDRRVVDRKSKAGTAKLLPFSKRRRRRSSPARVSHSL